MIADTRGAQRGGSGAWPKREHSEREGQVACNRVLGGLVQRVHGALTETILLVIRFRR